MRCVSGMHTTAAAAAAAAATAAAAAAAASWTLPLEWLWQVTQWAPTYA
jgi:hypothetical protein